LQVTGGDIRGHFRKTLKLFDNLSSAYFEFDYSEPTTAWVRPLSRPT
jgi:hypothetical protein